ncbi:MAG: DUF721 domain-containing protein [Methylovulum sp.]|nr:MAG: DUF721 domain-containing protein [Methylovulum sp.]
MLKKSTSFNTPLLCRNRTISYYYSKIQQQNRILQHIRKVLPAALAKQVRHCLVKDKKLLVYTDSAIWASQLRFYNKIMLVSVAQLSQESVETIQVKIITESTGLSVQAVSKARVPSAATIAIIRNDSLGVSDNQLKQALLNLSSTLERLAAKN